jgi:glyoxylate/hydroxypyruvate reductase A
MRIHIQNPPGSDAFAFTEDQLQQAASRAGVDGLRLSFADDDAGFIAGMADAEALVTVPGQVVGRFPVAAPALKLIFFASAGVDRLLPFDWLPDGVAVVNNSGAHGPKIGEFALMALLMLSNRMPAYATQQRKAVWKAHYVPILHGRHVTVVGTGDLGAAAARQARHFGMIATGVRTSAVPHPDFDRVIAVDDLDSVLPHSEFLILACPLTPRTNGMMDRRRLTLLPKDAGLLNIGRGRLLDQAALCDLLEAGHLSGAILDVTAPEPPAADERVWHTPNLLLTPHVSADNPQTYNPDSLDLFFANWACLRAGNPMPNQVDPLRGY